MKRLVIALGAVLALATLPQVTMSPDHWVNPRLFPGTVLEATYTPTPVKSIQRGSIVIANATSSNTATITSVTTAAASLRFLGYENVQAGANPIDGICVVTLTNATTVTANRDGTASTCTIGFEVLEYIPQFVNSLQRGTIAISGTGTSNTATITSVTTAKSVVAYLGARVNPTLGSGEIQDWLPRLALTNATTVTATRGGAGSAATLTVGYEVVEFK